MQWWYGPGWKWQAQKFNDRLEGTTDFFSISLLMKSLFQPFRQISSGKVEGSLDERLRAIFDKLLSRLIGAGIRLVIVGVGLITILIHTLIGFTMLLLWVVVPFLPVIGVVLMLSGWTP